MAILFHPTPPTCIFVGPCFHPQKKLPRKNPWKGKIYVAWRIIAMFWKKNIAFSGQKPFDSFKTRSYIMSSPRKNSTARNRKCWDFHFPPFLKGKNIPMGKPSPWQTITNPNLHDLSWTQNEKKLANSTRRGEGKSTGESLVGGFTHIFFDFHVPILGGHDFQFDEHIFQMGWNQPPTRNLCLSRCKKSVQKIHPPRVEIPKPRYRYC